MKRLGMIGGVGPVSTVDYYQYLVSSWRRQVPDGSYPSPIISCIDLSRVVALVTAGRIPELGDWLLAEIDGLARAGADFALISANTPHIAFDQVRARSPIPLLSIVDTAAEATAARGFRSVALLGTRFTMQGAFYADVFARRGMTLRAPRPDDLAYVHDAYMGELVPGQFTDATRQRFLEVIERLRADGAEAVLLAGTELSPLLADVEGAALPLLDTARIHVDRAIAEMRA